MKVDQTGRGFEGLRLTRSNGQTEFKEEWFVGKASKFNAAKWVEQEIGPDQLIIGVNASHTDKDNNATVLTRLEWQLWTPSNHE